MGEFQDVSQATLVAILGKEHFTEFSVVFDAGEDVHVRSLAPYLRLRRACRTLYRSRSGPAGLFRSAEPCCRVYSVHDRLFHHRIHWFMRGINNIYTVLWEGNEYLCRIKGKLLSGLVNEYNPIAVGDRVLFTPDLMIVSRLPRKNWFSRWNVKGLCNQCVAANIDILAVVASVESPPFRPRFLDRAIACCHAGKGKKRAQPVLYRDVLMERDGQEWDDDDVQAGDETRFPRDGGLDSFLLDIACKTQDDAA